jgi:hypothetical protein
VSSLKLRISHIYFSTFKMIYSMYFIRYFILIELFFILSFERIFRRLIMFSISKFYIIILSPPFIVFFQFYCWLKTRLIIKSFWKFPKLFGLISLWKFREFLSMYTNCNITILFCEVSYCLFLSLIINISFCFTWWCFIS